MRSKSKKRKQVRGKTKLGLPDLDHAKAAVLASLQFAGIAAQLSACD